MQRENDSGMAMTQGSEANRSGREIESLFQRLMTERGFHVVDGAADQSALGDFFSANLLIKNAPYTNIYGSISRSEFVIDSRMVGRRIRVECRNQDVSGSVDEKLPYLFMNMRNNVPETEILFLLTGDGCRNGAVEWLKGACTRQNTLKNGITKNMAVLRGMEEARIWVRKFCRGEI